MTRPLQPSPSVTWARTLQTRRGAVLTCTLILLVAALWSAFRMPVRLLPDITYPQIRVIADLPGQSAETIESALNEPLEQALTAVRSVARMQSRAGDERSYIDLFFDEGHDLRQALQEVNAAVQRAQATLPSDLTPPRVFTVSTSDEPALLIAVASTSEAPDALRSRIRASLLPALRSVPGVNAVHVGRTEGRELVVDVDPVLLLHGGWDGRALRAALEGVVQAPLSATLRDPAFEGLARLGEARPSRAALQDRILSDPGRPPLPLSEVARIGYQSSESRLISRLDGVPAVLVEVMREPEARQHEVALAVRVIVDEWSQARDDLSAVVLHDDAQLTDAALRGLVLAGLGGALLASLLLLLALRTVRHVPSVLLILSGSMSLSMLALHASGLGLDLMTMTGLLFAIGLGLDYVILFADRLDREGDAVAAFRGVAAPLAGALLTTLAAVLPFLLVEGPVARLFSPMILSVLIASIACFVSACFVLPAWGGYATPSRRAARRLAPPATPDAAGYPFERIVGFGFAAACVGLAWFALSVAPSELLPTVDDGLVRVRVNVPAGQPLAQADRQARRIEATLAALPDTLHVHTTVGGYVREGGPSYRPGELNFLVRVRRAPEGEGSLRWWRRADEALDELDLAHAVIRHELPRIRGVRTSLADDDVVVVLRDVEGNLDRLEEAAQRILRQAPQVEGLGALRPARDGRSVRQRVVEQADAMHATGLPSGALRAAVELATEGAVLARWIEEGEARVLRLRFGRERSGRSADLGALPLATPLGSVNLGAVATVEWREEALHIERDEGMRILRLRASRVGGGSAEEILDQLHRALADIALPEGVSWRVEGELEAAGRAMRSLWLAMLLCLLGVLAVVHLQYGHLRTALVSAVVLLLSGAGALFLSAIAGQPLSGLLLAGLLIALGIVANGAILIFSDAWEGENAAGIAPDAAAIREAAKLRMRPILLTVLTTSLGLAPLLFVGGGVSELLRPLALAVIGALLLSLPLLRWTLPALHGLGSDRRQG